jgi:hypothetical protein
MLSTVFQFLSSVANPLKALREAIHNYEEKKKIKEELADALETEIKEFEKINNEIEEFGSKVLPLFQHVEGQPTPRQLLEVVDCLSQTPRIFAKLIISFVHLAKACKEISDQKGFMDSLRSTNRFMHDFIVRIGSTYIEKDTVRIDGSFFRFFRIYKKELLKGVRTPEIDKKEIEMLEKRTESILRGLSDSFLKRHLRHPMIKKWKNSLTQLNKVSGEIQVEDADDTILKELVPPELRQYAPFLDKSP